MYIAVACCGLNVAPWVSDCSSFMCYKIECGKITNCQNLPNMCLTPQKQAVILRDIDVDVLIVNNVEAPIAHEFEKLGIEVVLASTQSATDAAKSYLSNMLYNFSKTLETA